MKPVRIFYPSNRFLIIYLSFLSAFAPISTDMYLPALPSIAQTLHTSNELAGATISAFMLVFAISMLFWGPISDRYGRKPVLVAGSLIYVVSSVAICISQSIWPLIIWRCVQAVGSGAASSMSLAIVKDVLRGSSMEKVITMMQAAVIVAPITAPVLGGWMMVWTDWRGIFWCLAICGAIALTGSFALAETNSGRSANSLSETFKRMGMALANRNFFYPLVIFSAISMPFMSYLGVSAFIFQDEFHLSAQAYSLFFALNAATSLLGPFAHMFVLRHYERNSTLTAHLLIMTAAGVCIILFGQSGPWIFIIIFAIISFCGSAMRAPSTVLVMEVLPGDNGIVAALINCGALLCGSFSMFLATMAFWPNPVLAVGFISAIAAGGCLAGWLLIRKKQ